MPLSPAHTRLFVVAFMALLLGLSVLAAVHDHARLEEPGTPAPRCEQETERNAEAPRLTRTPAPAPADAP